MTVDGRCIAVTDAAEYELDERDPDEDVEIR